MKQRTGGGIIPADDIKELAEIGDAIERLIAPYVTRAPEERPAGSRGVQLMRYVLPEAADPDPNPNPDPQNGSAS